MENGEWVMFRPLGTWYRLAGGHLEYSPMGADGRIMDPDGCEIEWSACDPEIAEFDRALEKLLLWLETPKVVSILDLAKYRGVKADENGSISGAEFDRVGLAILGGCAACGATIAAYNAAPSKSGYWLCLDGCIGDTGWTNVEEANADLFGEEDDDG